MRRFARSFVCALLVCVVFAAATALAYAGLKPSGEDIGNAEIFRIVSLAAWGVGPILGIVSLLLIGLLNLIRRLVRLREVAFLHPIVLLLGVLPWLAFSIELVFKEPRFTPIARAIIDFAGRPMLWGSLTATLLVVALSIALMFSKKPTL